MRSPRRRVNHTAPYFSHRTTKDLKMMRDMKKKINPRNSVSNDGIFSPFSLCLSKPRRFITCKPNVSRCALTGADALGSPVPQRHPARWKVSLHRLTQPFFFFASCHLITASWSGPCRFIMSRRTERWCDSRLVSAGPVGAQLFFQIQDSTARCVASFPLVFVFLSCLLLAYFNVVTAVIFLYCI